LTRTITGSKLSLNWEQSAFSAGLPANPGVPLGGTNEGHFMTQLVKTLQSSKLFSAFVAVWILMVAMNPALAETRPVAPVPPADLIQPAELAAELESSSVPKPLILHVGFRTMYDQSHIPGSDYAGPGNMPAGLRVLSDRVAALPKETSIVIYCGCCPWSSCPNIAAAYGTLHGLGFTNVKVLYIADNFGTDWVDKGYPATKDQGLHTDKGR
jgi:thiosulfate/3-mercaptopyruvate sulfurtransferase